MVGQTWANGSCIGTASIHNFSQAIALTEAASFAGYTDWRLPNIRELNSIVDFSKSNPTINTQVFTNAPASKVWSGSITSSLLFSNLTNSINSLDFGWYVDFTYGGFGISSQNESYYTLRLVRGGQSFGFLNTSRPNEDYKDNGDGTVTHQPTNLMWKRCREGQTWKDQTCSGTESRFSWDKAKIIESTFAGKTNWRLPTVQELETLVDYTKLSSPILNTTIFTNDSGFDIWSSSTYANSSENQVGIRFGFGEIDKNNDFEVSSVRLVRDLSTTMDESLTNQVDDINCLLDWAESRFSYFFIPTNHLTQIATSIIYRAYMGNIFLGVDMKNNTILILGGNFGSVPIRVGQISDYLPTARTTGCR